MAIKISTTSTSERHARNLSRVGRFGHLRPVSVHARQKAQGCSPGPSLFAGTAIVANPAAPAPLPGECSRLALGILRILALVNNRGIFTPSVLQIPSNAYRSSYNTTNACRGVGYVAAIIQAFVGLQFAVSDALSKRQVRAFSATAKILLRLWSPLPFSEFFRRASLEGGPEDPSGADLDADVEP